MIVQVRRLSSGGNRVHHYDDVLRLGECPLASSAICVHLLWRLWGLYKTVLYTSTSVFTGLLGRPSTCSLIVHSASVTSPTNLDFVAEVFGNIL